MIELMEPGFTIAKMGLNTTEGGSVMFSTDMVKKNGLMVQSMKGLSEQERNMARVFSSED